MLRLNDAEAEAAESQVWLKFAVKCQYLDIETGRKLYGQYNKVLGLIVIENLGLKPRRSTAALVLNEWKK